MATDYVRYVSDDGDVPVGQPFDTTIAHIERGVHLVREQTGTVNGWDTFNIGGEIWRKLGNGDGIIQPEQIGLAQGIDVTQQLQDFALALDSDFIDVGNPRLLLPLCESNNAMQLSDTVTFNSSNFGMLGLNEFSSRIAWTGTAGLDMFVFNSVRAPYLANFFVEGNTNVGNRPRSGFRINKVSNIGSAPMRGLVENVRIGGFQSDLFDYNVIFSCDDGEDANNEQWHFINCLMQHALVSGYWFGHSNSLWHKIIGGSVEIFGQSGINCRDVWDNGGGPVSSIPGCPGTVLGVSFVAGGAGSVVLEATSTEHQINMVACEGETASRLLNVYDTDTPGIGSAQINFQGGSYKVGAQTPTTPQIDCIGTNIQTVSVRDTLLSASNGVDFRADGAKIVLNIDGLSGNPRQYTVDNGAKLNLNYFGVNSTTGPDLVQNSAGRINFFDQTRVAAKTVQADGTLDCTDLDYVIVLVSANTLDTLVTEKANPGDVIRLQFDGNQAVLSDPSGNTEWGGETTITQNRVVSMNLALNDRWYVNL